MSNLIPDFEEESIRSPLAILNSTSDSLSGKTNGAVASEVIKLSSEDFDALSNCEFSYAFCLVGPLIDNYRFVVCRFGHDISVYPATFKFDSEISKEIGLTIFGEKRADNAEEVEDIFSKVFRTKRIASVVNSIRQLSKGVNLI
ncbi:hypothetical protein [Burkholderia cepacia]|uniref:hypothetical protein n=1 Tax=Burkholderia cepacia TaxID=292 RepID=UPI0012D956A4|nr:hypothetical protein [Burkholderia cepacia]